MKSRPLANKTIDDLEAMFQKEHGNEAIRKKLAAELVLRKTERAKKLAVRLQNYENSQRKSHRKTITVTPTERTPAPPRTTAPKAPSPIAAVEETSPLPPFIPSIAESASSNGRAMRHHFDSLEESVLNTWIAMEVLSPNTFNRPDNLTGGKKNDVAWFSNGQLPWEYGHKRYIKGCATYYQIILGSIQMSPAIDGLLKVYSDSRAQRPQARAEAVLACILVDSNGIPVENDAITLSSFGWGVPVALAGDLKNLELWPVVEKLLIEGLTDVLFDKDEGDNKIRTVLTSHKVSQAYEWLVAKLGLPRQFVKPPSFAICSFQSYRVQSNPETVLLNSFFLKDLALVKIQAAKNRLPNILKRYLGTITPDSRSNLLDDRGALRKTLNPMHFPESSWPSKGRHPLVLLQQCAVNIALSEVQSGGILAVNGPPGTGKTTLLRDIIAGVITERAKAMLQFDDPAKAFTHSGEKVKRGGAAFLHLYKVDERLRGYEIVVASSNNKAVENVSVELPGRGAVDDGCFPDGYFSSISRTMWPDLDTWGLISAVLGNAKNRSAFRQTFWWDTQCGMHHYLKHACGTPTFVTDANGVQCTPAIIQAENPPSDHMLALVRWDKARAHFKRALKNAQNKLKHFQKAYDLDKAITSDEIRLGEVGALRLSIEEKLEDIGQPYKDAAAAFMLARHKLELLEAELVGLQKTRPGFFSRLFNTARHQAWKIQYNTATNGMLVAKQNSEEMAKIHREIAKNHDTLLAEKTKTEIKERRLSSLLEDNKRQYKEMKDHSTGVFIDDCFFNKDHHSRQSSTPWLDSDTTLARGNVFEAAVALHKAFIDAAAKPIRHNLGIFLENFGMKTLGKPERDRLIPDLWTSFFLSVPVVSTTFASAGVMLSGLGQESLGWLLIDEAGQALPQAAIGSLYRFRRAVIVGDPLQIEPIVTLPETLTEKICDVFGVNANLYNPPGASVQTLADRATDYVGSFETKQGTREVGVPLLVHRRCDNPMFRISNAVAYENLMVQQKFSRNSSIRDILGPSSWIHISGNGNGKWNPNEGDVVLDMLNKLKAQGCSPDLYMVTPFVDVQNALRELIEKSGVLLGWVPTPYEWGNERIGTVHTVQGREAEAVIFMLGASGPVQIGARVWAGKTPNLVNVAVTRAKEALYVIGDNSSWRTAGAFSVLHEALCK